MSKLAPYAKAIIGALVAGLAALASALEDGSINSQEYVTIAAAFLVALGAIFAIPNASSSSSG